MTYARISQIVVRVLAACGLLLVCVSFTPLTAWWTAALAGAWNDPEGDVLIVLGGSVLDDGTIGESSYWRTVYAISTYRRGRFRQVVISGGGEAGRTTAATMATFLVCGGVPREAIRLEDRSRNTRENALMVRQILGDEPGVKVLLTSDYHMLRAYRAFTRVGIDVRPRPFPDALKRSNSIVGRWGIFMELIRETTALIYYFGRGWV